MHSLSTLRRKAAAQGFGIRKVRETSRHFSEYGPFCIYDLSTSLIGPRGLTVEEVADWIAREPATAD